MAKKTKEKAFDMSILDHQKIVGVELDRSTRVFARNGERRKTQSKRDCEMAVMQLLFHCTQ